MKRGEEDIVIHPRMGKSEKAIPENGLLLVNPTEAYPRIDKEISAGGESRFLFNSRLCVTGDFSCFFAGPAIGAPMAAMTLEKLIVMGARRIILCGWCGAIDRSLRVGDIVVPASALSGEGTSAYYTDSTRIEPSRELSRQLAALFSGQDFSLSQGTVWSTDAVYRESRTMLRSLSQEKEVVAVDMEFSALCSVASFRQVELAAVLVVSDEIWGDSWRPGFSKELFHRNKDHIFRILRQNVGKL